MRGLSNKIAVVAGGGGGIGAATAVRLAEEGAVVVVGDLDGEAAKAIEERIRGSGGRAIAVQFDMSDDASVGTLVKAAVDTYGGLDLMHANAADFSQIYLD
nr:SDR family NAD(P)-dependent oxidoreductase [Chloroflexota bacterium]